MVRDSKHPAVLIKTMAVDLAIPITHITILTESLPNLQHVSFVSTDDR